MYKGNGSTKVFPLPEGADGRDVYWETESSSMRLREGVAYSVKDGCVVFETAPPIGVTVAFEKEGGGAEGFQPKRAGGRVCTVIYGDGSVAEVSEDPVALLAAARLERDEASRLLKAAVAENEKAGVVAAHYEELAKKQLDGRISRYSALVEDAVKQSAALARDEVNDNIDRKIVEIRRKHKEVIEASRGIAERVREAKEDLERYGDAVRDELLEGFEDVLDDITSIRGMRDEAAGFASDARRAAADAGAEVIREIGKCAGLVVEEMRSARKALDTETASVAAAMSREAESVTCMIREHRAASERMTKNMNRIERYVIDKAEGGLGNG